MATATAEAVPTNTRGHYADADRGTRRHDLSVFPPVLRSRARPQSRHLLRSLVLALVCVGAGTLGGVALAVVGHVLGPFAVVAVPLVALGVFTTQAHPSRALLLVVLAVPVGFVAVPLAGLELIEVVVLVAAGLVALARVLDGRTPLVWPRLAWWPLGILALTLVSSVQASDMGLAIKQTALFAGGMLLLLATVTALPDRTTLRRVSVVLALVGGGLALHGLTGAGQFEAQAGALSVANRPTGIFTSPNQLGAAAGMTVLVGAGLALGAATRVERLIGLLAVLGGGAGMLATLSRGAWFATGVALLAFLLRVPEARRTSLRWILPTVAAVGFVGAVALPETAPQVQVVQDRVESLIRVETSPYDNRTTIWAEALRQVRDRPVVGQGPGNFPVVSQRSVSETTTVGADHAHNTFLHIGAEFGIPALLLVIGFVLSLARVVTDVTRRARRPSDRALLAGLGGALVVQVAHGFVDHTLQNAVLAMLTWLVAGMLVAADEQDRA